VYIPDVVIKNQISIRERLANFATENGFDVDGFYTEKTPVTLESLEDSEINRLLNDCVSGDTYSEGDILLIEDVSVFSDFDINEWQQIMLCAKLKDKRVRVVVSDIRSTLEAVSATEGADQVRLKELAYLTIDAISSASKHAIRKRKRAADNALPVIADKPQGKKIDIEKYIKIIELLAAGMTYKDIETELKCSSRTIARAKEWSVSEAERLEKECGQPMSINAQECLLSADKQLKK
jgi:DNA invertase Pin-like site-specific DNA recombinase